MSLALFAVKPATVTGGLLSSPNSISFIVDNADYESEEYFTPIFER